jgi:hypothetical protein
MSISQLKSSRLAISPKTSLRNGPVNIVASSLNGVAGGAIFLICRKKKFYFLCKFFIVNKLCQFLIVIVTLPPPSPPEQLKEEEKKVTLLISQLSPLLSLAPAEDRFEY